MKKLVLFFILLSGISGFRLNAQWVPDPATPQEGPVILRGATIHVGDGTVLENADIAFDRGNIIAVGTVPPEEAGENARIIDVKGKHIYPGLILPDSKIGLSEISAFRATYDHSEEGKYNPNLNTAFAYTSDSEIIPTLRYNGILMAEAAPAGGIVSGSSSIVKFDGWNWKEAVIQKGAMHMNWPNMKKRQYDRQRGEIRMEDNKGYQDEVREIKKLFADAVSYGKKKDKTANLKLEAMQPLFQGGLPLFIHVNESGGIKESINMAREMGIENIAVITAEAALPVREFLAEEGIPVILPPTLSLPSSIDADYDLRYKLPYLLTSAGIKVALSHSGSLTESRNLPFYAGMAAAYGLSKEDALRLVTSNTAEILGIDKLAGTLEAGKQAVSGGDLLDIASNAVEMAFIQGRPVNLENKQQKMYKKYAKKYGKEGL